MRRGLRALRECLQQLWPHPPADRRDGKTTATEFRDQRRGHLFQFRDDECRRAHHRQLPPLKTADAQLRAPLGRQDFAQRLLHLPQPQPLTLQFAQTRFARERLRKTLKGHDTLRL